MCWSGGQYELDNGCSFDVESLTTEGYGSVEYCSNLVYGGHNDWELPTAYELFVARGSQSVPGGAGELIFVSSDDYWSISEHNSSNSWYIGNLGQLNTVGITIADKSAVFAVSCVRSI